jgi:pimeloyl-ACP methyl ester carboxylesterase
MSFTYLWDENGTRYYLAQQSEGPAYNWLFVPGGPGCDSRYLLSLVQGLELSGNVWLIDFPENGSNVKVDGDYNFNHWFDCLLPVISKFQNPIYVGHSFGAMLPLLFPELENLLKGFVILNSAPSLWLEEAARVAQEKNIPILSAPMEKFQTNPNTETFKKALAACLPYYFPPHSLTKGAALLENIPFNFHAAGWWLAKVHEINFDASWIPRTVPTMILSGTEDCIAPCSLFENDRRFERENIIYTKIQNAGHMPWVEKMDEVKRAFNSFIRRLQLHPVNQKVETAIE